MYDLFILPDSKVHAANMGPTWVLSSPDGPHVGPMNFAIRAYTLKSKLYQCQWVMLEWNVKMTESKTGPLLLSSAVQSLTQ